MQESVIRTGKTTALATCDPWIERSTHNGSIRRDAGDEKSDQKVEKRVKERM